MMQSQHNVVAAVRRRVMSAVTAALVCALTLVPAAPAFGARVFLDAGHGGRYPGAVYAGIEEQYVNLLITLATRNVLTARGHEVKLSRTGDYTVSNADRPTWHWSDADQTYYLYADGKTGVYSYDGSSSGIAYDDLQARCDAANGWGADLFISIHNNAGGTATGTETFYNSWNTTTDAVLAKRLATYIQQGVVASAGTADRRVDDVGYYVIRWCNMPGALVECAFLSSSSDRAKLLTASFRQKVAVGIANGVDRYLASNPYTPLEPRIQGTDRYGTSAAAALDGWPTGADTVILASGEAWPDSLAAAPLSATLDGPVLLTASDRLVPQIADAIGTLGPERIVVLGGEAALASEVASAAALAASIDASSVARIAGRNRYETAARIAEAVGDDSGSVTIVSGEAYPDAVSASAFSGIARSPILLTPTDVLAPEVTGFLEASTEVTHAVVVGGPAVVSEAVVDDLGGYVAVEWLWGRDRYATNRKVVERFWSEGDMEPLVATADNFPDALVAGALAAKRGQPVVLCGKRYFAGTTREWVMHNTARIGAFTMVGGEGVLPYLLEWELRKARRVPPP